MTPTNSKSRRRRHPRFPRTLPPEIVLELKRLFQSMPRQPQTELAPFDQLAGKLVSEAFAASVTGRLSTDQWESIAAQADAAGFVLRDHLEQQCRKDLATWNKMHSLKPDEMITSFTHALKTRVLRRGVLRRLYRAKDNYLKICSEVSGS
jgi:hypothetical protein